MKKLSAIIAVLIAGTVLSACGPAQNGTDASKTTVSSSTPEGPVNLIGTWKADGLEAEIADNSIVINIVSSDSKSLYWKGTFSDMVDHMVVSKADTEALSMSMLGSQDSEKKFIVDGKQIHFEMSIAGTTKTISLKKV